MALTRVSSNMINYNNSTATSSGGSLVLNFSTNDNFIVTLTENTTLANPTGLKAGQRGKIIVTQNGTAAKTLSFGSYWVWSGTTTPTVSTTLNSINVLDYFVIDATHIHLVLNQTGAIGGGSGTGGSGTSGVSSVPTPGAQWLATLTGTIGLDAFYSTASDSSGNIFASGYSHTDVTANPSDILVAKYSSAGSLSWQYKYAPSYANSDDSAVYSTIDSTGNYYFSAQVGIYNANGATGPTIVKVDTNGNILWQKELKYIASPVGGQFNYRVQAIKYHNNYLYYVGTNLNTTKEESTLLKLDLSGNIIWQKKLNYTGTANVANSYRDVNCDSLGNVYVIQAWSGDGYTNGAGIIKYDSSGTIVWKKFINNLFISNGAQVGGRVFDIDSTDNLVIFASRTGTNPLVLIKINSAGSIVWKKDILLPVHPSASFSSNGQRGVNVNNNGIYIFSSYNSVSSHNTMEVTKLDSSGTVLWSKNYYNQTDSTSTSLFGANLNNGGNILMCGMTKLVGASPTWDSYLMQINDSTSTIAGTFNNISITSPTVTSSDNTTLTIIDHPITTLVDSASTYTWADSSLVKSAITLTSVLTTIS
jgi:hypothetical protein